MQYMLQHIVVVGYVFESTVNMVTKTLCNTQRFSLRLLYRAHAWRMREMPRLYYLVISGYSVVTLSVL